MADSLRRWVQLIPILIARAFVVVTHMNVIICNSLAPYPSTVDWFWEIGTTLE